VSRASTEQAYAATNTVSRSYRRAHQLAGIDFTPAATFAYVVNRDDGNVSVISTATNTVVATIPVGNVPNLIAFPTRTPIGSLIAQTQALADGGSLTQNHADGLIGKLNQVITKLDEGQTAAACNQLSSFINQFNAFVDSRALTLAEAQPLIDADNAIRASNGC
jgi:YVTN family beta-propeller protein